MSVPSPLHPGPHHPPDHLIRVLRLHAEERPRQSACIHLLDGRDEHATLTYAQLDRRARAIAARLQERGLAGQGVLLVYRPGLDFIAAFFGCLYAGCVAVPTYPPHRHRLLERFQAVAADAGAVIALSTAAGAAQYQALMETGKGGEAPSRLSWLATDEISDDLAERWHEPAIRPDALAMLQYTSGATSQPKGVMLTHGNLMANVRAIHEAFGIQPEDSGVFWLPMYHDMGLVGGVLVTMFTGATSIFISPPTFLQSPITWLAAISKYRATISGGPSFAYDLCLRAVTDEQRATLDLSSWALAFVGAEPIEPEALERFAAVFASRGFKPTAFYPCYGLAEATLMVSGARRSSGATVGRFDDAALNEHRVEPTADDAPGTRRLVACGSPIGGLRVVIVDPHRGVEVAPDRVGEIWVNGPSISHGYWHKPDETRGFLDAHLSDTGEGAFLRTGDLGFMREGQLYITGRLDDLIIIRGLNRYPQDIEATARLSHPLLESGFGAVFVADDQRGKRLVMVQEAVRKGGADFAPVLEAIRTAVLDAHGIALDAVVLVRTGTLPRTSSGKIPRRACRVAFLTGELNSIAEHHAAVPSPEAGASPSTPRRTGESDGGACGRGGRTTPGESES